MLLAESSAALQIEGDIDDGVKLVFGPFLGRDHVTPVQMCLHQLLLCRLLFFLFWLMPRPSV
jgi:hypothetical protein